MFSDRLSSHTAGIYCSILRTHRKQNSTVRLTSSSSEAKQSINHINQSIKMSIWRLFTEMLDRITVKYKFGGSVNEKNAGSVYSVGIITFRRRKCAPNIVCLPYFHTWCDLCANLECRSEMCCTRLAANAGPKKSPKIAICAPSHNFVGLHLRNQARIDNRKKTC